MASIPILGDWRHDFGYCAVGETMSRPGTILIVEDDPGAAESLQYVLEDEGHTVIAARTGEEGLALAGKERCDLVLTDLKLPGLSGLDLVKRLHTARARLPIILMTAHGTTEIAIEATRHGAFDYLLKPFEMPTMLDAIQKALAASRLMFQPVEIGNVRRRQRRHHRQQPRYAGDLQGNRPRRRHTRDCAHPR